MEVVHKNSKTKSFISTDYTKVLGDWEYPLTSLLISDYMDNLTYFINEKYKSEVDIFPSKDSLFKPFRLTSFKDVKVVIITENPYIHKESSGIGFGIKNDGKIRYEPLPSLLGEFVNCMYTTIYNTSYQSQFDSSLQDLAEQGILFLNSSMTIEMHKSHELYWRNFIRNVIKEISDRKKDIIFVFLTSGNDKFKEYIDLSKHYILENNNKHIPQYCNIFNKIDAIIEDKYDRDDIIQW